MGEENFSEMDFLYLKPAFSDLRNTFQWGEENILGKLSNLLPRIEPFLVINFTFMVFTNLYAFFCSKFSRFKKHCVFAGGTPSCISRAKLYM